MARLPTITIDTQEAQNCKELVRALQNAYVDLVAGNKRVRVRFQDRWTEYEPGKEQALRDTINMIAAGCPDTDGLLNFNRAYRAQRGRPARFFGV